MITFTSTQLSASPATQKIIMAIFKLSVYGVVIACTCSGFVLPSLNEPRSDGVAVQRIPMEILVKEIQGTDADPPRYPFKAFSSAYVKEALRTPTDWRRPTRQGLHAVTAAKDQGPHGYCGTFARVAAAEGQYGLLSGLEIRNFSVEQLVDCIGWDKDQFAYIIGEQGGFESAEDYPFNISKYPDSDPPKCTLNRQKIVRKSNEYTNATAIPANPSTDWYGYGVEDMIATFVHHNGPVQAGINANVFSGQGAVTQDGFVTRERCGEVADSIDHSITIVGYNVSKEHGDYWIIKNSWGATWHDHGFVYLPRGINCANITQAGADLFTMGNPARYYDETRPLWDFAA